MAKELIEVPQQELAEIKTQITGVQRIANDLMIASKEDLDKATDVLHNVKALEKLITERKEDITRPLMKALASARDLFKPLELTTADATKVIKAKMLAWQIEEDDRIQKEAERIAKRVEKGTMKAETAAMKLETIGEAPTKSTGAVGKSSIRVLKKVRIIDETIIPREYMIPSVTLITEAVLYKGVCIPGVEVYEEKTVVSR